LKKKYEAMVIIILVLLFLVFLLSLMLFMPFVGGAVSGESVGVIPIKGEIVLDSVDTIMESRPGARKIISQIKAADEDPFVSAILLDINSGGGSVVASKEIMRAVKNTNKPVVAYIGEMGASGAYYIASASDEIVCDENSLTGSLGAVMVLPNYVGLLEKIGVNMTLFGAGEHKTMGSPYGELTEEEEKLFRELVESAHEEFKQDLLENRGDRLSAEKMVEFTDGRIMDGKKALEYGLVDDLGSRDLALQKAALLGGIEGMPNEKVFAPSQVSFSELFAEVGYSLGKGFLVGVQSENARLET
jgi:protease-4